MTERIAAVPACAQIEGRLTAAQHGGPVRPFTTEFPMPLPDKIKDGNLMQSILDIIREESK